MTSYERASTAFQSFYSSSLSNKEVFQTYYDIYKLSDLAVIPDEEVLVLVVDDLDELVSDAAEPEEGGEGVEVGQLVVEVRHRVVAHAQVGADAVSPE